MRLLLIVGLVPAVLAAGLPLRACSCVTDGPAKASCCCCGHGSPCASEDGCPCKAARRACRGASGSSGAKPASGGPHAAPALGCSCASRSAPAAPAPTPVEVAAAVAFGLPAVGAETVTLPAAAPLSAERLRSALLPTPDLPTVLCALVI
jgi:hypothetical protein